VNTKSRRVAAVALLVLSGCPSPTPVTNPPREVADAAALEVVAARDVVAAPAEVVAAEVVSDEPPPLATRRFEPLPFGAGPGPEGTPPAILPNEPPEGDSPEPPDIGAEARAALQQEFGCGSIGQAQWPTSWLSPTGVVLWCCSPVQGAAGPDDILRGCMLPFRCSLLIDEGVGAVTRVDGVTPLRRRVAPLRDPRTALAMVEVTQKDFVGFFGGTEDERRFVLEGPWTFEATELPGTRVVESPDGGSDVTTYVQAGCGCNHDLFQVVFHVDELAGVTEQSRTRVLADRSGLCVD
jgi:hypothetical protein